MRRHRLLLIFLLLIGLAISACDSPPAITKLSPGAVVLAFGDSLTFGTGAAEGRSYPTVLSELLGVKVVNAGVPGEVTARGLERLPGVLAKVQPDLVILCHGGNDFLRRQDRAQTRANLEAMITLVRDQGADLVLLGVPQFGFVLKPPEFYGQLAKSYRLPYEKEIVSELLSDRSLKSDQIHPNTEGYRLMAEAVHNLIRDAEGG